MTSRLILLEPATPGRAWAPFAGVRPLAELSAGIWKIRERWEAALDLETSAIMGDHVAGFHDGPGPEVVSSAPIVGPVVPGLPSVATVPLVEIAPGSAAGPGIVNCVSEGTAEITPVRLYCAGVLLSVVTLSPTLSWWLAKVV